jgi:hypothetical protein
MYNISFDMRAADTVDPVNGPNGRDCASGSDQRVDAIEFDGEYTCDCANSTGTTEPNCDTIAAAAEQDPGVGKQGENAVIGIGVLVAIAIGVGLVVFGIAFRAKRRPTDMSALQGEILASLGVAGTTLNIGRDELGFTMMLGSELAVSIATAKSDADEETKRVAGELLATLRDLGGLPNRLHTMLKHDKASVVVVPSDCSALLLLKRPLNYALKSGDEELFAAALQRKADKKKIVVGRLCVQVKTVTSPFFCVLVIDFTFVATWSVPNNQWFGFLACANRHPSISLAHLFLSMRVIVADYDAIPAPALLAGGERGSTTASPAGD